MQKTESRKNPEQQKVQTIGTKSEQATCLGTKWTFHPLSWHLYHLYPLSLLSVLSWRERKRSAWVNRKIQWSQTWTNTRQSLSRADNLRESLDDGRRGVESSSFVHDGLWKEFFLCLSIFYFTCFHFFTSRLFFQKIFSIELFSNGKCFSFQQKRERKVFPPLFFFHGRDLFAFSAKRRWKTCHKLQQFTDFKELYQLYRTICTNNFKTSESRLESKKICRQNLLITKRVLKRVIFSFNF